MFFHTLDRFLIFIHLKKYVYLYLTIFMSTYTLVCQAKLSKCTTDSYLLGKYTLRYALFIFFIYGNKKGNRTFTDLLDLDNFHSM